MSIERIKFRGKVLITFQYLDNDNKLCNAVAGEWFIADTVEKMELLWRAVIEGQIDPNTVGQWTGLVDKNGVGIYEHDRCRFSLSDTQHFYGVVVWREKEMCFVFKTDDGQYLIPDNYYLSKTEVIGNVHEVTT